MAEGGVRRRVDVVFALVAVGLVGVTLARTRAILMSPDGLPAWDAAGYPLVGLK